MTLHEFAVIDKYFKVIARSGKGIVLGPGDDCAIVEPVAGDQVCISTDTLIESVHFPEACRPEVVAQRTVAANLSDLAAMGATPLCCVLALTLPGIDEIWLEAFAGALARQLDAYNLPLAGGNLSRGGLSLTMTVMGTVPADSGVLRSTAHKGDDIYISGTPGDAGRGLELVKAGTAGGYLVQRYEDPTPRIDVGRALRGVATAMIDVSDGLAADVMQLCNASGLGAEIQADKLCLSDELVTSVGREQAVQHALFGGDDYELCFTAPARSADDIAELADALGLPLTCIGRVTQPGFEFRNLDGSLIQDLHGYRHFS